MKAVVLAGGLGSRLSEETSTKPKPMDTLRDMIYLQELWEQGNAPLENLVIMSD